MAVGKAGRRVSLGKHRGYFVINYGEAFAPTLSQLGRAAMAQGVSRAELARRIIENAVNNTPHRCDDQREEHTC